MSAAVTNVDYELKIQRTSEGRFYLNNTHCDIKLGHLSASFSGENGLSSSSIRNRTANRATCCLGFGEANDSRINMDLENGPLLFIKIAFAVGLLFPYVYLYVYYKYLYLLYVYYK